jgi:hypothetical protein
MDFQKSSQFDGMERGMCSDFRSRRLTKLDSHGSLLNYQMRIGAFEPVATFDVSVDVANARA